MNIPGIPESITRQSYIQLIESLGLPTKDLMELTFGRDGISAVVRARDSLGNTFDDPIERNALATHRITIQIKDGLQ